MKQDELTHIQLSKEMVEFVNFAFDSTAWLVRGHAANLRELNKDKLKSIMQNKDLQVDTGLTPRKRAVESQFSWLGLTKDGNDITIVPRFHELLHKFDQKKDQQSITPALEDS